MLLSEVYKVFIIMTYQYTMFSRETVRRSCFYPERCCLSILSVCILVQPKKINGESFIWRQWKALASIIYYFCVWIFTILYLCRWFPAAIRINDYFVYLIRIKIKEPVKMINQCIFIIHKYLKLNFSYILNSSFGATTHIHILAGITKNFRAKPFSSHSLYLWSLSQRWKTLHIHSHPYTQMNWSFW